MYCVLCLVYGVECGVVCGVECVLCGVSVYLKTQAVLLLTQGARATLLLVAICDQHVSRSISEPVHVVLLGQNTTSTPLQVIHAKEVAVRQGCGACLLWL